MMTRIRLLGVTAILLALALRAAPAAAQQDTAASVPAAMALIQSGRHADAATMLTAITARDPGNARAWSFLGYARFQLHEDTAALAAYAHARAFDETRPTALYNSGLLYGRMGNLDSAFALLEAAKATRKLDITQIGLDPDAAELRQDPRYRALFPTRAEFAHPFVEPVTVIREWDGESAGDQFGWIARNIGDVDHDGVNDVTTSAPTRNVGGANAGRVYVYSTKSGKLLWTRDGRPGDRLGIGIEAAGDVNHDGTPDVIAGAPGAGKAYVYSGRDGRTLRTFTAEDSTDGFGRHVADAGDVNGDGYADVIVGAPLNDAGGNDAGRAYLYSGRDGRVLRTFTGARAGDQLGAAEAGAVVHGTAWIVIGAPAAGPRHTGTVYVYRGLTGGPAFTVPSDSTGAALGAMFVSVVGDVNGDGTPDIYASDWPNRAKGRSTGRIYVYSGKTGTPLLTLTGETAGDGFGIGPADQGDVNHDGYDDLVIGAWQFGGAAPSGGRIYVYSGKDGTLLRTITGRVDGETLGFDATGMGDVDGDGTPDMLVTSAWSAIAGTHSGRMYVIKGQ
ncbi:MAG TPA: FG-GAP-like repeat-containing protein [Gemmatimonadales bacterium]|nr:FG-GAP-like repeat-containing protein [Gemmatimonadales bacterium]